jgi:hypothetical protein
MIAAIMSVRVFERYFQVGRTSIGCGINPVMDGTGRKVSYIRGRIGSQRSKHRME